MTARVLFLLAILLAGSGCAVTKPAADPLKTRLIERENRFLDRLTKPSAPLGDDPDLMLPVDDMLLSPER